MMTKQQSGKATFMHRRSLIVSTIKATQATLELTSNSIQPPTFPLPTASPSKPWAKTIVAAPAAPSSPRPKISKCSSQKARLRKSQIILNEDEVARRKAQKLAEKFRKIEEKKRENLKSTVQRIQKEDLKRAQKLQQFHNIQEAKERKLRVNEEIHSEKMRAYELIKAKLDLDTRRMLGRCYWFLTINA